MRRSLSPRAATFAAPLATLLACTDGTVAVRPSALCAAVPAAARRPIAATDVAGEWWAEGAQPPTLHLVADGTGGMRGELAFSGVARPNGVGTVADACLRLTCPAPPGTSGPPLLLEGALVGEGRLRIVLDGERAFVLVRRT